MREHVLGKKKGLVAAAIAAAVVAAGSIVGYVGYASLPAKLSYYDLSAGKEVDITSAESALVTDGEGVSPAYPTEIAGLMTDAESQKSAFIKDSKTGAVRHYEPGMKVEEDSTIYFVPTAKWNDLKTANQAGTDASCTWYIINNKLYVIGSGALDGTSVPSTTINISVPTYPDGQTFETDETAGQIDDFTVAVSGSAIAYSGTDTAGNSFGVSAPAPGDENKYTGKAGEFYSYTTPTTGAVLAGDISFDRENYPNEPTATSDLRPNYKYYSTTAGNQILGSQVISRTDKLPWSTVDSKILGEVTEASVGSDVALSGDMAYLFNMNTDANGYFTAKTVLTDGVSQSNVVKYGEQKQSLFAKLQSIYFYADTTGIVDADGMFANCPVLEHIYTDGAKDFHNTVSTTHMFYGDTALLNDGEQGLVDNIDLSNAVNLNDTRFMFAGCKNLAEPAVSEYCMTKVQLAQGMFLNAGKAGLTIGGTNNKTDIGGWNLSSLVNAEMMFSAHDVADYANWGYDAAGFNPGFGTRSGGSVEVVTGKVDLSKWGALDKLEEAFDMFGENDKITEVEFGPSYAKLQDISDMFVRCDYLGTVNMTSSMPSLVAAQYAFAGAGSATPGGKATVAISTAPGAAGTMTHMDFMFYKSGFGTIDLSNTDARVLENTKNAIAAFADMPSLTAIATNNNLAFPNLVKAQYMFYNDPLLQALDTKALDLSNVANASFMFANDKNLAPDTTEWKIGSVPCTCESMLYGTGVKEVDLSKAGGGITSAALAFASNPSLTKVTLPSVGNVEVAFGAFSNDPVLQTVTGAGGVLNPSKSKDSRGLFCGDSSLVDIKAPAAAFIVPETTAASFAFKDCTSLKDADLSGVDTTNCQYMEGMFDGDSALSNVITKTGTAENTNFTAANALSLGMMFKDCALSDNAGENIVSHLKDSGKVTDFAGMFEGNKTLTILDLSPMDFTSADNVRRMMADCDLLGVVEDGTTEATASPTITLPGRFASLSCINDTARGKQIFAIEDGKDADSYTDDELTHLIVSGGGLSALGTYSFHADNRKFLGSLTPTVDGAATNVVTLSNAKTSAALKVAAEPMLAYSRTVSGSPVVVAAPVTYSWADGDGTALTAEVSDPSIYIATTDKFDPATPATVIATASLTDLTPKESGQAVFTVNNPVKSMTAEYKGDPVTVGNDFAKSDVAVTLTYTDGTKQVLPNSQWTVPSQTVTKVGDNEFTVTYTEGSGDTAKAHTAKVTVPGVKSEVPSELSGITATYTGNKVVVGKDYAKSDVTVKATSKDGKTTTTLSADDWTASGTTVTKTGDNTFTATVKDEAGNTFTAEYTVPGYVPTVTSMSAIYTGKDVLIGSDYTKGNVKVTVTYDDGTTATIPTSDWTASGTKVTAEGTNSFTATYTDPNGTTHTAPFTVTGVTKLPRTIGSLEANYTGPAVPVGDDWDPDSLEVIVYYSDDKNKTEGFAVTPTAVSSKKVNKVGTNTYKAYYTEDGSSTTLSDDFTVNGYQEISSITASYIGDPVKVGNNYAKSQVIVKVNYPDGKASATLNDSQWSESSLRVSLEGPNTYTATYQDGYGHEYKADYVVEGLSDGTAAATDNGSTPDNSDYADVTGTYGGESTSPGTNVGSSVGTSTGVVQTGREGRIILYVLALICAGAAIVITVMKKKSGNGKKK